MKPLKGKVPARLSSFVLTSIEEVAYSSAKSGRGHAPQAVADLSRLFTKERSSITRDYLDDPDLAAAYLRYFLPVNLAKIQVLLDELPEDWPVQQQGSPLRVLDVGSGPGTGALAVLDWLHRRHSDRTKHLAVVAVDSSSDALNQAKQLWAAYCREAGIVGATLSCRKGNLERLDNGEYYDQIKRSAPYDLVILANCLNELFIKAADRVEARANLVAELLQLLAPHGTVMLLEPALRETSRGLHQVRDRLLQERRCTAYSPCLHELNCPALLHPDDWCHEERAWDPPVHVQEIDQEVGFIKDALKFSYLLLRKDGRTIVPRDSSTFRIVSELRELKGDTRAWVCNELGRSEIGRLDRAESETNAAWDDCQRGAIVRIEALKRKEGATLGRISSDGTVEIIRPA